MPQCPGEGHLETFVIPTPVRLGALWTATMFCYVYGDFFGLFLPGSLAEMNRGIIGPLGPATPVILSAVSAMMAVPAVMIVLSLILPPVINRWLNIGLGLIYTAIMLLTMIDAPPFYLLLGAIEVTLTLAVVMCAWRWPRCQPAVSL